MEQKVFPSLAEFERAYFPDSLLDRLEERVCSALGLTEKFQYRLSKNEDDPKTGGLEFARVYTGQLSCLSDLVKSFYQEEGFTITQKDKTNLIQAKKGNEQYWIHISEGDSYLIWILKRWVFPTSITWGIPAHWESEALRCARNALRF